MKYLMFLMFMGCSSVPLVLPDTTRPSIMEESIKHNLNTSGESGYLWVLWYIPIVVVVLSWAWKTFFRKGTNGS